MLEPVIGLEIHAQLSTRTKLFCDDLNDPEEKHPNVNICPVCMGHPGTLPVLNKKAVEAVVKVGLALGSEIAKRSKFDRKNYFYPDLPKGYQISQYDMPFCTKGKIRVGAKDIRITRVHLEEDTGRLVHDAYGASLVDFNRAGVPLMELVTEPDIATAEEAVEFARKLQLILQYVEVSRANMEKGEMRCEVNISMREKGGAFGTKVEVKNLNSFAAVREAIEYEMKRQAGVLEKGGKVAQETRGWDENKKATVSQRAKESAHDYRYFPEPDLPVLELGADGGIDVERLRSSLPELPEQKQERFQKEFGISEKDAALLVSDKAIASFFEHVESELGNKKLVKLAVNYFNTDLRKLLNETGTHIAEMRITPENFAELIVLVYKGTTSAIAKAVLAEMFATGKDPSNIIEEKGLTTIGDAGELEVLAAEIITANQKAVADFKAGHQNALQFLVGQLMGKTRGKADPELSREILLSLLKK